MATKTHPFKCIVAAVLAAVGFSGPLSAESLDEMFDRLAEAAPDEAGRIQDRIITEWGKSGSAAIDLLLRRGSEALEAGDHVAAVEHYTAAIDHAPDFAEAWHGRATAYFLLDYYGPALDDLRQTLVLNPRHFGALRGFAIMLEELGRPGEALEVYRQVLDIHPHMPDVAEAIERLELELNGQAL